jgi:hypothetical protein
MTSAASSIKSREMPYYHPFYPEYSAIMKCYDLSNDFTDTACKDDACETIMDGIDEHGPYVLVGFFPLRNATSEYAPLPWHDDMDN